MRREKSNRDYLMSLSNEDLLFTYNVEAGRYSGRGIQTQVLGDGSVHLSPEVLGCARAYEVFGGERWIVIVRAYWKCAVTDCGYYVTGG